MWTTVTMDNGALVAIGGGWNLPPSYPNYCATWIEITGTEGSLFLDDTQRDNWLDHRRRRASRYPMSTMPGEQVDHVFAGPDGPRDAALPRGRHPRPAAHGRRPRPPAA